MTQVSSQRILRLHMVGEESDEQWQKREFLKLSAGFSVDVSVTLRGGRQKTMAVVAAAAAALCVSRFLLPTRSALTLQCSMTIVGAIKQRYAFISNMLKLHQTLRCRTAGFYHPHPSTFHIYDASANTSPNSTFPTLQISLSSSISSLDKPKPPAPPSASFLSLACPASLIATLLK